MTADDRAAVAELVASSRAAQGLPRRIEDRAALDRIATLTGRPS